MWFICFLAKEANLNKSFKIQGCIQANAADDAGRGQDGFLKKT